MLNWLLRLMHRFYALLHLAERHPPATQPYRPSNLHGHHR